MSSYGWRDIGLGPRREEITIVGNFDFQNETKSPADIAKEYCSNCQVKLVYSNIIKKWICPKHGCNLTQEESDILLGKATASTSPAAANVPTTASVDDLPPGVGGGFIPSTQQSSGSSSNNVINRQKEAERTDGGGHTIRIPSSRKSKEEDGKYRLQVVN